VVQPQAQEEPEQSPILVNRHQDTDQVVMQACRNNYEGQNCNALFNYLIYLLSLEYNYMIYVMWRIMWCVMDLFRDLFYYV